MEDDAVRVWNAAIYEPEILAFGGAAGMRVAAALCNNHISQVPSRCGVSELQQLPSSQVRGHSPSGERQGV